MTALAADAHTKASQRRASDPGASAWVSANAGSGKTTVLRNRVLRLLLAGVDPGRILCLTFTRAAAAEMSIRVFKELANWVGLDDVALGLAILDISGIVPTADTLDQARRLFARAIETPGGLRIDTIHGFCTRLLQTFAVEANVPARFTVLEDQEMRDLIAQAQAFVLKRALSGEDRDLADALARVGEHVSHGGFAEIVAAALGLRAWATDAALAPGFVARQRRALSDALGIGVAISAGDIEDEIVARAGSEFCRRVAEALGNGTAAERQRRDQLLASSRRDERLKLYQGLFLTQSGGLKKIMLTKTAAAYDPLLPELMEKEAGWLARQLDRIAAVETRERTLALLALAQAIRRRFAKLKADRGALDFDDLIGSTQRLLARASAAFVLFKLDAAIEHLLVDEAQDTNRDYWAILRALTAEFTAGGGARGGRLRTVFAVGDEKQSIFGFQGAEPATFGATRAAVAKDYAALEEAGRKLFHAVTLNVSFRSTRDVLTAVDAMFASEEHFAGLTSNGEPPPPHESTRGTEPGAVDLWSPEEADAAPAADPFQPPGPEAPVVTAEARLARRVATQIRRWTTEGCDFGRHIQPGDILILVRRRARMFQTVIRALKRAGVPVAGADRLSLSEHIAVDDLVAAGRAALLPEDDLTVAALLKSPFIGLTDDDLLLIAPGRTGSLREALRQAAAAGDARLAEADASLARMREAALGRGAFGFYAHLLGPGGGRLALMARLGPEAAEASDEVLRLALAFERAGGASLAAFVQGLQAAGADIKRDLSVPRGEVRVMTVHGSKGLEAPIVILADACSAIGRAPPLLTMPTRDDGEVAAWVPRAELHCDATRAALDADAQKRAREDRRLLYVAMTRAKDRLVIAGCRPKRAQDLSGSWFGMAEKALSGVPPGLVELPCEAGDLPTRRWRLASPVAPPAGREPDKAAPKPPEPEWLRRAAPAEPPARPPLRPSSAFDAAEEPRRPAATGRDALLAGRLAHKMLEFLPQAPAEQRASLAERIASRDGAGLSDERRRDVTAKVLRLVDDPALGPLFSQASLAEVVVVGRIDLPGGGARDVSGRIDRLAVTPESVLIADFKSGDLPASRRQAVAQLAAYRALVRELYPGRVVRCFIVLLDGPRLIEPAASELDAALADIGARP